MNKLGRGAFAMVSVVMAAAAMGGGCGGGDSTGSGGGSNASPADGCQDLNDAYCEKLGECSAFEIELIYGDVATCKKNDASDCKALVKLNGADYDGASAESCASSIKSSSCADVFYSSTLDTACVDVGRGKLKAGAACAAGAQCDSFVCVQTNENGCGECAKELAAGQGNCTEQGNTCARGTYCDASTKCVKMPTKGEACRPEATCADTSVCINGTCADHLGAGAACDAEHDACDILKGLSCNESGHCAKIMLSVATAGESCGIDEQSGTFILCDGATFCSSDTGEGTCKPRLAEGAACTSDAQGTDHCSPGTRCLKGKCSVPYADCK